MRAFWATALQSFVRVPFIDGTPTALLDAATFIALCDVRRGVEGVPICAVARTVARMANVATVDPAAVRASLKRLRALGMVERDRRGLWCASKQCTRCFKRPAVRNATTPTCAKCFDELLAIAAQLRGRL